MDIVIKKIITKKNIPNIITIIRFVLIIPIITSLLAREYPTALFVFFVAGVSDGLDGLLARRFNWTSRFGAIADPLADKMLMLLTYITLAYLGKIPLWLMAAVIGRDLIIIVGALLYHFVIEEPKYGASFISKVNTSLQLLLVGTLLFEATFSLIPPCFSIS